MELNFLPIIVAALIPTIVGFIYYNPKVLGAAWLRSLGKTEEELKEGFNTPVVLVFSLILSFLLAFFLNIAVELMHRNVSEAGELISESTHTFGHGAFHGLFFSLMVAIPLLVMTGMYERKSWKNLLITAGYWTITITLMSGLMDAWN